MDYKPVVCSIYIAFYPMGCGRLRMNVASDEPAEAGAVNYVILVRARDWQQKARTDDEPPDAGARSA